MFKSTFLLHTQLRKSKYLYIIVYRSKFCTIKYMNSHFFEGMIYEDLPGVLGIQGEGLFIFRDLGRVIYFQGFGEKAWF